MRDTPKRSSVTMRGGKLLGLMYACIYTVTSGGGEAHAASVFLTLLWILSSGNVASFLEQWRITGRNVHLSLDPAAPLVIPFSSCSRWISVTSGHGLAEACGRICTVWFRKV